MISVGGHGSFGICINECDNAMSIFLFDGYFNQWLLFFFLVFAHLPHGSVRGRENI